MNLKLEEASIEVADPVKDLNGDSINIHMCCRDQMRVTIWVY